MVLSVSSSDALPWLAAASALLLGALAWRYERDAARNRAQIARLAAEARSERDHSRHVVRSAVEALAHAIEAKTGNDLGHLKRVHAYAAATARELGLSADECEGIRVAALLHDVGRLGVPDNILMRTGQLSMKERERARAYPTIGARILEPIPFDWPVAEIVRRHREHFDGSGYPDGLAGEAIPLGARIVAVVDTYDVLVSGRAYRAGLPHEEALATLRDGAGSEFDPAVVEAFCRVAGRVNARMEERDPRQTDESVALQIAGAQREIHALYELVRSMGATLQLHETLDMVCRRIREIVDVATCAVFLLDDDGDELRAQAAQGVNCSYFAGATCRVGTYLTGRAVSRGEAVQASFLADDVEVVPSDDPWVPLRSTLIVPLKADGGVIGTLNLYHTYPDAFSGDDLRLMLLVGELTGRAIQNAKLYEDAQETALTDPLTGLRNARFMRRYLDLEMNRSAKTGRPMAVLAIDLDRFKQVNDTRGHAMGDLLLREMGQLFLANVRNYDLVVRCGGDEFAVILPDTNRESAARVAEKIKEAVRQMVDDMRSRDGAFPAVGVSIGSSVYPDDAAQIDELLAQADRAMYNDKRAHRAA
jgi:diguanylate cyclase (GGDEF)-like protein